LAGFKESLKQAVRQMSLKTSVDSLKKRGVQEVNVLGLDRIVGLVETAVSRALRSRMVGIERVAIEDAAKAEFLRLLKSNETLQQQKSEIERQKDAVEEELDLMRRELSERKQELQVRLEAHELDDAARYEGENATIRRRIAEVLAALAGQPVSGRQLEARVAELVIGLVGEERRSADAARSALRDREVENLQRRIAKLGETLQTTERRLQQVAATKDVEQGISSIYRDVQGVRAEDDQGSRKKELMAELFKANLALQKKRGG
jgi:hypothetical protein